MPHFGDARAVYNVIDSRQSYLQRLLKQALAAMGYRDQADRSTHFAYEMVALSHATAREFGFAAEADARGIRPTNLCWLSEWAAVGQIPKQRNKSRSNTKPVSSTEPAVDYEAIRQRMEVELPTLIERKDDA